MTYKTDFIRIEVSSDVDKYFNSEAYPNQDKILSYLKRGRKFLYTPHTIYDPVTGVAIARECHSRTDEKYSWTDVLIYLVDKYNYRLPEEVEKYILKQMNIQ